MTSSDEEQSESENGDDDSCAGDLQLWLQDDSHVKPSERTQTMITLAHCYVNNFSTNVPPFNNKVFDKCKKQHKVTVGMLKKEIKRRAIACPISNKKQAELLEVLQQDINVLPAKDHDYLKRELEKYKVACEAKINEQAPSNAVSSPAAIERGPNITYDDWFRAIEALLSDAAKPMMLQSQECLTRQELDARNSAMAVVDYFQMASTVFNDSTWIPSTTPMPGLHSELAECRALPLKEYRMTGAKMKEKYDSLKKRLHLMICNWEKSGNGGLQRDDSAPDWGTFSLEETVDGDDRANFLPQYEDGRVNTDYYLLYFWEKLDKEGYVQFTLAKLPEWMKSNSRVFSLVATDRKGRENEKAKARTDLAASIATVGEAIKTQATESVARNINSLEKQLLDVDLKLLELQPDSPAYQLYDKRKSSLTADIVAARKRMKPTPTPEST